MRLKVLTTVTAPLAAIVMLAGCGALRQASASGTVAQPLRVQAPSSTRDVPPIATIIHPRSGKFFGLEANGSPESLSPVQAVSASVGRNPNMLGQYVAWNSPFDPAAAANALNYGALYYAVWEPFGVTVQSIADGASNAYITKFARAVRSFGRPIALSFGHEMNGNWYPWGTAGTTAAEFVAAWRNIHDLFAQAGVDNVIWVWNPNVINPVPQIKLEPYWPGNAYVDWVGITGYFALTGPDTFQGLYGPTMNEVRKFTSKPFIIAETSVESGPNEVASVDSLIDGVKASSDVLGFIWFNYNKDGVDWTMGDRPRVRIAFANALAGMKLARLG